MLQTTNSKFSRSSVSSISNCCGLDDDDFPHMLLEFSALINQRKVFYPKFKPLVFHIVGINQSTERFTNRNQLVQLILTVRFSQCKKKVIFHEIAKNLKEYVSQATPSKITQTCPISSELINYRFR